MRRWALDDGHGTSLTDLRQGRQPPSPFLTAASCFWPTSVTKKSGGGGESTGPSNSSVTKPRPSVNSKTVTLFEPSGELPDNVVPSVPTLVESVLGSLTTLPSPVFAEFSALVAAAGSGRTWMVSRIWTSLTVRPF